MSEELQRTAATDYLESLANRDRDSINAFLAAGAHKPAPEEKREEPKRDYLTEAMRRGTGGR